jgi:hypothetical protein
MIWSSDMAQPTTFLGNKQLHKKHSVMVQVDTNIPRARVMDQHIADRYLMDGLLSLGQHRAAEYLLDQAAMAGMWATGVDLSKTRVNGGVPNNVPFRIFPFGRSIGLVRKRFGDWHAYLVQEVICHEWDIRKRGEMLDDLRESLDWIGERRMAYAPIRKLRKVVNGSK